MASCPKHLVANDTETQRQQMSATVDDATLREVYLRPFELALRDAGAWAVMAAYNRLNGVPCTAHPELLRIVKEEWGWDGLVVSDYFALKDTLGPGAGRPGPGDARPGDPPRAPAGRRRWPPAPCRSSGWTTR